MIDPPDTLVKDFRYGNSETLPTPTGGPYGEPPVADYDSPRKLQPPMFKSFLVVLTNPGDGKVLEATVPPEYWTVSGLQATGTAEAMGWAADSRGAQPELVISGSGNSKIPGTYHRLYVENTGVGSIRLLVRAITGYDLGSNNW